jgi:hypothetical protein
MREMVGTTRLELATSTVTKRRSNQLNYAPASLDQQQTDVSVRISNAKSASLQRLIAHCWRVYRYRCGETANFPQRDFWLAIVCDRA